VDDGLEMGEVGGVGMTFLSSIPENNNDCSESRSN